MLLVPVLAMSQRALAEHACARWTQQIAQFGVGDRGGFARGAGDDDARGAIGNLELEES